MTVRLSLALSGKNQAAMPHASAPQQSGGLLGGRSPLGDYFHAALKALREPVIDDIQILLDQQPPQTALTEKLHVLSFQPHRVRIPHHPRPHPLMVGSGQPKQALRRQQRCHPRQRQPRLRDVLDDIAQHYNIELSAGEVVGADVPNHELHPQTTHPLRARTAKLT